MENHIDIVTGMFHDKESAERAYHQLGHRGYTSNDTQIVMTGNTRDKYFSASAQSIQIENRGLQVTFGNDLSTDKTLGSVLGAITEIGTSSTKQGLGLIVAGSLAARFSGVGNFISTGGIIRALVRAGMTEERATICEASIRTGGILLCVYTHNDEDAIYFNGEWNA